MAFNGSGVFNRIFSWTTDKSNSVPVTASRVDQEDDGFATGLSNTICKDGQQTTTARIPFALGVSSMAGTVSNASYAQTGDLGTGIYFPAAGEVALAANGTQVIDATSALLTFPIAVSFGGTFSVTGAVTLSSTLGVSATVSLGGVLAVAGAASFAGALTASATASVGLLNVAGLATFSSTSHLLLPSGTTGQRPSNAAGAFRYNSTLSAPEYNDGSLWRPLDKQPTYTVLTSGSSATYTTPSGCLQLFVRMVGGGAPGGNTGITNGTGTTFGSVTANPGLAGGSGVGGLGGTGGAGSATFRSPGMPGLNGGSVSSAPGSPGFPTPLGFYGSGGFGAATSPNQPGGGAGEYVELAITSPSATYTYTVGAAGTGASGTGASNGGNGVIIVEERY